jgi:hypothetical protein
MGKPHDGIIDLFYVARRECGLVDEIVVRLEVNLPKARATSRAHHAPHLDPSRCCNLTSSGKSCVQHQGKVPEWLMGMTRNHMASAA